MKNPLFEKAHPLTKLFFLFFIIFFSFSILLVLSLLFSSESILSQKLLIAVQHVLIFIVPAILGAILYSKYPFRYLHLYKRKPELFILAGLIIITAIPLINYTGMLNSKLSLPDSMSSLEEMIKQLEETAEKTTKAFLNVSTLGGLILNLIIVAILPAIGEEIFFRGIILNLLKDWTKNIHVAIILSSILFSAMHLQFYGFLPRMLLGMLFAYLLVWSGSIWLPILAHFINNALAVIVYYFLKDQEMIKKTDTFGTEPSSFIFLIVSTAILFFLLYFFKRIGSNKP